MMYTKDDWKARRTEFGEYEITSGKVNIACVYLTQIEPSQGTAEANAHLIAKSPRMYELLKEIYEAEIGPDCVRILKPWFDKVEIILAEGK